MRATGFPVSAGSVNGVTSFGYRIEGFGCGAGCSSSTYSRGERGAAALDSRCHGRWETPSREIASSDGFVRHAERTPTSLLAISMLSSSPNGESTITTCTRFTTTSSRSSRAITQSLTRSEDDGRVANPLVQIVVAVDHALAWPIRVALIAYKRVLSPWLPAACRFYPTCSEYGMEALARFGLTRGLWLLSKRVLRCRPGCEGGVDPVPERSVS